ncbi:MAG: hypothetical protein IKP28_01550, partial [Clostridia bacterium]|nr:hypothetical protein [Clostridia bacterium]
VEGRGELEEAERKIKVESNKESINEKEEEIELKVELGNNEENSALYSNPEIRVKLPEFVEAVEVTNANILFEDELAIANVMTEENEEGKAIRVNLEGTQTEFSKLGNATTIVLGAKLTTKEAKEVGEIVAEIEGSAAKAELQSNVKEEAKAVGAEIPLEEIAEDNEEEQNTEEPQNIEISKNDQNTEDNVEGVVIPEQNMLGNDTDLVDEDQERSGNSLEDRIIETYGGDDNVNMNMMLEGFSKKIEEGQEVKFRISPMFKGENQTGNEKTTGVVITKIPEGLTFKETNYILSNEVYSSTTEKTGDEVKYNKNTREIMWTISDLSNVKDLQITAKADKLSGQTTKSIVLNATLIYGKDKKEYTLEGLQIDVVKSNSEIITQTENVKTKNKEGDEIAFIIKILNSGGKNEEFKINVNVPEDLTVYRYSYSGIEMSSNENEIKLDEYVVNSGETGEIKIMARVNTVEKSKTVTVNGTVNDKNVEWEINLVKENTSAEPDEEPESTEPTNPDEKPEPANPDEKPDPTKPDENPKPSNPDDKTETYSVSGIAWLDSNGDGIKQADEEILEGITVKLLSVNDKKVFDETTTGNKGKYIFENVKEGKYQVEFTYESDKYELTEYLKGDTPETSSSVVKGKEEGIATSDTITITNEDIQHINIGVTKILKFDMSLEKIVSKIVVQNDEGTKTYEYGNNLAKADINGKYISNTVVLVEYKLIVKNEGELAGRVKEIVDYLPSDMQFTADLNKSWTQASDGNLYNSELKNIDINPGESKEVTLVLKKAMTNNNVGLSHNVAELSNVENIKGIKDIDSTPKNKIEKEDDMSSADVILGIKTGTEVIYTTLVLIIIIIITSGIYAIKRTVIEIK